MSIEQPSVAPEATAPVAAVAEETGVDTTESTVGLDHRLLTASGEVELAQRMEAGLYAQHLLDTGKRLGEQVEELAWLAADGCAARTEFIEQNLRLALATARKFRGRGFSEEDLRQDAFHGLVKAVDRFDYKRGFKFSTYAVWWIRESILSGIRDSGAVRHPEALWNQIVKVRAAKMQILDETGDTATVEQIAQVADISVREVTRCLRSDLPISSLQVSVGEGLDLHDVLRDDDALLELGAVEYRHDHDRLRSALTTLVCELDEEQRAVLVARYGLDGTGPRTLTAVAAELGLNRQTVRVREQRAMAVLSREVDQLAPFRLLLN